MPTILTKRSNTPGAIPATANLTNASGGAELAVNTADKRLFTITSGSQVVELGTNPASLTCADASFTLLKAASASITNLTATSLVLSNLSIASANVTTLTSASATITNLVNTSASITTLTNNPTFGAGTANGVLYLNGSKVATSGSALVFDGTNLGIGTSSPSNKLHVNAGSTALVTYFNSTSASGAYSAWYNSDAVNGSVGAAAAIISGGSASNFAIRAESALCFATSGNTERMRIDASGNLGIGTASPASKLGVTGSGDGGALITLNQTTTSWNSGITLQENGTNKAYFDYLNSAWGGGVSDTLRFGTIANAPIRFMTNNVEKMRLDSSGNLGLGVTPSAWSGASSNFQLVGGAFIATSSSTARYGANYYYASGYKYTTSDYATLYQQAAGQHQWHTAPSGTAGNDITFTQAMTLTDSNLQLNVNTLRIKNGTGNTSFIRAEENASTAAYTYLTMDGRSTGYLSFSTNDTERARITSGGDLYIGTTTQPGSTQKGFAVQKNSTVGYYVGSAVDITTAAAHYEFYNPNGTVGSITTANSATTYSTTSDVRLKKNIVSAQDSGADVDALKVRSFDWKVDDFHVKYGFIAQELVTVAPEAVKVGDDGDEVTDTWGVDYSKLVPMLVKEIQSLRARVAALEAK